MAPFSMTAPISCLSVTGWRRCRCHASGHDRKEMDFPPYGTANDETDNGSTRIRPGLLAAPSAIGKIPAGPIS